MKKYISSKPLVKIIVIALFSLILSLIGLSSSSASDERNLKKTLKIIDYCNKTNPQKLNVYKNLRKSELINEIDRFVKQIKADEKKFKFDFLNNATTIEKCDSFKHRLDNITNTINKSFKITDSQVENLICGECFDPELPNDCETIKFVQKLVEASSENTPYVWANAEIYQYFIKSQDAIRSNDYNNMCSNFNNIHPLVDKYIKNIPNCSTCPDGNCEWCETIQDELKGEFNFLKLYIEIQKGYFFVHNKTYTKAESYFNQLLSELSSQLPQNPTLISCRNNTYIEKMSPLTKQKLIKSCYFFIGYIQMLQKRYTEANNSFLKFHNLGNYRNQKSYTDLLPFPRSGLYQDFDCQEIVSRENIDFPSTIIKMHAYTFYFMGICNENLGNKDAALTRYREYVKFNDPDYLNDAQNRILKLENIPTPIEISEIKFLRPDGSEVKWGDILETGKKYLIKIITKTPFNSAIKIKYSSYFSSGVWFTSQDTNNKNIHQVIVNIDSKIIGLNPDNSWKFVTFDFLADNNSNFEDSKMFIKKAIDQLGYINCGYFQNSNPGIANEIKEDFEKPVLPITDDAFKNLGVEYLKLEIANTNKIIPFKNQANMLYYSGHGFSDGILATNVQFNPKSISQNEWDNLRVIIIAGCSVLGLDNLLQIPGGYPQDPGIEWLNLGNRSKLKYLLGYRKKAPLDNQSNAVSTVLASKNICNNFFDNLKNQISIDWCSAWMKANYNSNGRNACAIELKTNAGGRNKYHYWIKRPFLGIPDYDHKIRQF